MAWIDAPAHAPVALDRARLHASLRDPVLGAIGFLNEIMDRFPEAISFAPGAPFPGFFDDIDVGRYLATYTAYLRDEKSMNAAQVDRLLYQYGASKGHINELVARALRIDDNIDAAPEAVVITVGCQEAMLLVLRALCASPRDLIAVVNPCFAGIAGAARLLDVELVAVDELGDGVDLAMLRAACASARGAGRRIRALYVAPDYANPSGTVFNLPARRQLLALAEEQDFLLIEDNAYGFTAAEDSALPTLAALDTGARVIYLGTCAKMCFPGLRVGFVVAPQLVRDGGAKARLLAHELATLKSMVTVNTSPLCQAIVGGMLLEHGGSFKALCRDKSRFYRRNLELMLAALARHLGPDSGVRTAVTWNRPQGGFFVRMRLPVPVDEALLHISAQEYGVLWTPMSNFSLDQTRHDELRLACSYLTPEAIDEGIRRLAAFLRDPRLQGVAGAPAAASGMAP